MGGNFQWNGVDFMEIKRDSYLEQLISYRFDGLVKVITGIRRCGKSYLLKNIYRDYLIDNGVKEEQIITIELDLAKNIKYRNPLILSSYVREKVEKSNRPFDSITQMQQTIVNNWNDKITNGDTVYILGDVSMRGKKEDLIALVAIDKGPGHLYSTDVLTDFLQEVEEKLEYKHWYFGHYHMELDVDDKHSLLYHAIIPVEEYGSLAYVPVPGRPRYHCDEMVRIKWDDAEKVGKVFVVDAFGTMDQNEEPSYDILVEEDNCLYKHIYESDIIGKILM